LTCGSIPKSLQAVEEFFTRVQQEGEGFDPLHHRNKNFGELEDPLVRDKMLGGIRDLCLQERLLRQSYLSLKIAEEHSRAAEISSIACIK
ncbi:unnamed protein product, partial [Acanthoscelides obtectus]